MSDQDIGVIGEYWYAGRAFIDLDEREIPKDSDFRKLLRLMGLQVRSIRRVRTARGWHVIIQLRSKLGPAETIALQSILGSDRKREALNLRRWIAMKKSGLHRSKFHLQRFNILFSYKLRRKHELNTRPATDSRSGAKRDR